MMRGLLFEVTATDPLTFVAIAAGITGVAVFGSYVPASRAAVSGSHHCVEDRMAV